MSVLKVQIQNMMIKKTKDFLKKIGGKDIELLQDEKE